MPFDEQTFQRMVRTMSLDQANRDIRAWKKSPPTEAEIQAVIKALNIGSHR